MNTNKYFICSLKLKSYVIITKLKITNTITYDFIRWFEKTFEQNKDFKTYYKINRDVL